MLSTAPQEVKRADVSSENATMTLIVRQRPHHGTEAAARSGAARSHMCNMSEGNGTETGAV